MNSTSPRAADRAFFANLFSSVTDEMGTTLARTAYSPNIKERRDFSCAWFDACGDMVAQAAHIPVHLGAMPASVRAAYETCGPLAEGDVVLLNDPFAGGTHLPDLTLVSPVIASTGDLIGTLASRAHHADVGGMSPGSLPLSTSIYQEGIRIPPLHLYRAGTLNEEVLRMLLANVRTPSEREGDLRAQFAAHQTGARRLGDAAATYGLQPLRAHIRDLLDYGEALMRATILGIPDGSYPFEDVLDNDGITRDPLRIRVSIHIRGDQASIDFAGTAPACAGSLNAVEAITRSAVYYCFLCLLVTPSRLHPIPPSTPPLNTGCFRPLKVRMPPDSLVNASPPHAVAGGNVETSQRIVDVVFGALAQALPDIIPAASQGTMNNLTLGGLRPDGGEPYAYYETLAGGMGARPSAPGIDGIQAHMTNTQNTPIEALEFAYPFRAERYALRAGSGGTGTYRGGCGVTRVLRLLAPAEGAILSERRTHAPYGLAGGDAGALGRNRLTRRGRTRELPGKCRLQLLPGDVLRIDTPGGGGHGGG